MDKYERQLAASRAWKQRNKDRVKAYAALWNEANKALRKELKKKWDAENEQHRKDYVRKFKERNPAYHKDRHLKLSYGIPLTEYERMLHNQKNRCYICGKHVDDTPKKRLFVDHDHNTGKVRALLCQQCNTALGMVHEDVDTLLAMVAYIQEHKS